MTRFHWIILLLDALAIRLGYQLFVLSVGGTFGNGCDTRKYVSRFEYSQARPYRVKRDLAHRVRHRVEAASSPYLVV